MPPKPNIRTAAAPPPSGFTHLRTRRLISISGHDSPRFLQGILTNTIQPHSRAGVYSAFLTASGRVLHDVFVYPTLGTKWEQGGEAGYMIEVDGGYTDQFMRHLKKHKLRAKFGIRVLEEGELNVWNLWRDGVGRWTAHTKGMTGGLGLTDCRAPGMGQRVLLPGGTMPEEGGLQEAPDSAYMIRRYLRGVPEGQVEIPREESLPMNCNIDIMGGIDFKKGCYMGQELTIRTHHTGVVRKRILPVALYPDTPPDTLEYDPSGPTVDEQNADIRRQDKRKRSTGKLVASIGNVGLAMCRVEQMTDLAVSGEGSPFSPEDRFTVTLADGTEVGVKAFVPAWMRGRIREPKIKRTVD
ncbi:Aminomethyltransferase folate-binding domain-containing protein [Piedraia hortae CBS 480.64]|uniref:Iron-sulfur cluster assembly factor IBA57 homolog, mitochondrial n=1 Tax=Piedraia hortae CBS 480.64 TaxID=1314780 RepID=A0A6A7C6Y6_9PEZI|nr:Aminomethyltransferase folate-binding domain-containing protein [Piedraia hortae CBS 480.64]